MKVTTLALAYLAQTASAASYGGYPQSSQLGQYALQKVLSDASQIFGVYKDGQKSTATWMRKYADNTPIVRMNIPGTHDSQTWNYSQATQDRLAPLVALNGVGTAPNTWYRCQEQPLVAMLNDGIRAFDLRYAIDVTNTTLVFYHSQALQSEVSTLDDVLFGFYKWLDDHPSEAVFLSLMYEGSTGEYHSNNAQVQTYLYTALNTAAAKHYINQVQNELGTLGQARGKITLFRRFDLDQLPPSYEASLPGLHFSPSQWTDNGEYIPLTYNTAKNLTAYIEDFYTPYSPDAPLGAGVAPTIRAKLNATEANFNRAINAKGDQYHSLFWSFASSTFLTQVPPDTPYLLAVGNGTNTPNGGVNQGLKAFFKKQKNKRLGICMFDFYDVPSDLVQSFLDIGCE